MEKWLVGTIEKIKERGNFAAVVPIILELKQKAY